MSSENTIVLRRADVSARAPVISIWIVTWSYFLALVHHGTILGIQLPLSLPAHETGPLAMLAFYVLLALGLSLAKSWDFAKEPRFALWQAAALAVALAAGVWMSSLTGRPDPWSVIAQVARYAPLGLLAAFVIGPWRTLAPKKERKEEKKENHE